MSYEVSDWTYVQLEEKWQNKECLQEREGFIVFFTLNFGRSWGPSVQGDWIISNAGLSRIKLFPL